MSVESTTTVLEIRTDVATVLSKLDSVDKRIDAISKRAEQSGQAVKNSLGKSFSDLGGLAITSFAAIGSAIGNLASGAIANLGAKLIEIGSNGVKLAPTVSAFHSLTAAVGESGDAMLKAARTSTKGLISDLDLMQAANKGLLLGLPLTTSSFGLLSQTAVVLGKAMGQGPVKSFDDLITALGRSSPMILDNLGLSVKVGDANEKYARSVHKTAEELSDAEKKLAFYNAAMDAAKQKVEEVGGLNLTLADRVQQVKVQFKNFTDALGVAIATSPALNKAFGDIGDGISSSFGENQTALVLKLIGVVNDAAVSLVGLGTTGIKVGGFLAKEFIATQVVFGDLLQIIDRTAQGLNNIAATTSFGQYSKNYADEAARLGEAIKNRGIWLQQLKAKEAGVDEGVDKGIKLLEDLRAKMEEASKKAVDAAKIAEQLARLHRDTGDAAGEASEKAKKSAETAAEKVRDWQTQIFLAENGYKDLGDAMHGPMDYAATITGVVGEKLKALEALVGQQYFDWSRVGQVFSGPLSTSAMSFAGVTLPRVQAGIKTTSELLRNMENVVSGIPDTFIRAFEGGGDLVGAVKSIAVQIGQVFIDELSKSFQIAKAMAVSILNVRNVAMAGASSAMAGIGTALASGKASQAVGASAMAGASVAAGALSAHVAIGSAVALGAATAGIGLAAVGAYYGLKKLFGGDSKWKEVNDTRDQFIKAAGGLAELNRQAVAATGSLDLVRKLLDARNAKDYAAALNDLNAAIDRHKEASDKFGPSKSELIEAAKQATALYEYIRDNSDYTDDQEHAAYIAMMEANAAAGDEAAKAWLKSQEAEGKASSAAQQHLDDLTKRRDELMASVANEAPEEVMGVIESQTRGEISALDRQIEEQRRKMEQGASDAADTIETELNGVKVNPINIPVVYTVTGGVPAGITAPAPVVPGGSSGGSQASLGDVSGQLASASSATPDGRPYTINMSGQTVARGIMPFLRSAAKEARVIT